MGLQEVKAYFEKYNIANEILILDNNTATVNLAAAALGKEPGEIAKTLAFELKDGSVIKSLQKYSTVFPAAGTPNSAVEFTIPDLEKATQGVWIDVCK